MLFIKMNKSCNLSSKEELAFYALLKKRRQNTQAALYIFIAFVIIFAFLLGLGGFSFLWIFGLLGLTFLIWITKIFELTEQYIAEKEVLSHRKKALRQEETAEWLNFLLNRWWMFSEKCISEKFQNSLNPFLEKHKPPYLQSLVLESFSFGENTPIMQNIRVFDCTDGTKRSLLWALDSISNKLGNLSACIKHRMKIVIEAQVDIRSDQFAILKARLAGKWTGMLIRLCVERLNLKGNMQATFSLDLDTPFPHISSCSICFLQKPDLWFNVCILQSLQIMEIPLIKMWVHHVVMTAVSESLVDPGKIDISFLPKQESLSVPYKAVDKIIAKGVLTINIKGIFLKKNEKDKTNNFSNVNEFYDMNDYQKCIVQMGLQEFSTDYIHAINKRSWTHSGSFLIHDYKKELINIEIKRKFLLTDQTLDRYEIIISKYDIPHKHVFSDELGGRSEDNVTLKLNIIYFPLPDVSNIIEQGVYNCKNDKNIICGVLTICIHGATGLDSKKENYLNPYCIIYNGKNKICCTHYIENTSNPKWETLHQILIEDITKVVITFVVCNWNGINLNDDDYLGSTQIALSMEKYTYIHHIESLRMCSYPGITFSEMDENVCFSIIFCPVPNLQFTKNVEKNDRDIIQNQNLFGEYILNSTSTSLGYVEIHIIEAKYLPIMDRNGFSDPFCEVYLGKKKIYTTAIKKKTLSPYWDEIFTFTVPTANDTLQLIVWDADILFRREFSGSLSFDLEDLKRISSDIKHDGWFKLEKTKNAKIKLKINVFLIDPKEIVSPSQSDNVINPLTYYTDEKPNTEIIPQLPKTEVLKPVIITETQQFKSKSPNLWCLSKKNIKSNNDKLINNLSTDLLKNNLSNIHENIDKDMPLSSLTKIPNLTISALDNEIEKASDDYVINEVELPVINESTKLVHRFKGDKNMNKLSKDSDLKTITNNNLPFTIMGLNEYYKGIEIKIVNINVFPQNLSHITKYILIANIISYSGKKERKHSLSMPIQIRANNKFHSEILFHFAELNWARGDSKIYFFLKPKLNKVRMEYTLCELFSRAKHENVLKVQISNKSENFVELKISYKQVYTSTPVSSPVLSLKDKKNDINLNPTFNISQRKTIIED